MHFEPMERLYEDQPRWGAAYGPFSFIITEDDGKFTASARSRYQRGDKFEPGKLYYLGGFRAFDSMQAAVEACHKWYHERTSHD